MMMRFSDICSRLLASKNSRPASPDTADSPGVNPLASLRQSPPPAPAWEELRTEVLRRANVLAEEQELATRTGLLERAQFATAMALFIVIACCILGLLLPSGFGGDGDSLLAQGGSHPVEPALASFQHP